MKKLTNLLADIVRYCWLVVVILVMFFPFWALPLYLFFGDWEFPTMLAIMDFFRFGAVWIVSVLFYLLAMFVVFHIFDLISKWLRS